MTDRTSDTTSSTALQRSIDLMRTECRAQLQGGNGYIDLLGKQDRLGPHSGQQLYRIRTLPLIYERLTRPLTARFLFGPGLNAAEECRITLEMLDVSAEERVLDVGCGPGNYTRGLAEIARDGLVVGIDASKPMIVSAAKRGGSSNLAYVRGDGSSLPFLDGVFDAVSSVGAIHMMEEPMKALDEMIRVLVPGGRMVIVATYNAKDRRSKVRAGMTVFGRDELTSAMIDRGLSDIKQKVKRRGQFVVATKPVREE